MLIYPSLLNISGPRTRDTRDSSMELQETDSLEMVSGSQITGLPSSEISRRSRLSDIFPDILNFKSLPEVAAPLDHVPRDTPSPDYNMDQVMQITF